jgi:hypothetical protein
MGIIKDIHGQRFGRLLVTELVDPQPGNRIWRCRCDCGNERVVKQRYLMAGGTRSCGCLIGQHKRTHGATGTPEFMAWDAMRQRCTNPKFIGFKRYGGRGISVCERWQTFEAFFADMGPRPSADHSVDREDNDGNYEPSNCRWATKVTQSNNRHSNLQLTFRGETRTAAEWERHMHLPVGIVSTRLKKPGWDLERALTTRPLPPNERRKKRVYDRNERLVDSLA